MHDGFGLSIGQLQSELDRIPDTSGSSTRLARDAMQGLINTRSGRLESLKRTRTLIQRDLSWSVSEVNGYRRALALIDRSEPSAMASSEECVRRVQRRLDAKSADVNAVRAEVAEIDRGIEQVECDIVAIQEAMLRVLVDAVDEAATRWLITDRARRARLAALQARRRAESRHPDSGVMWSPVAVLGFRIWELDEDGLAGFRRLWRESHMEAECRVRSDYDVPHTDGPCLEDAGGCGIYAAKSVDRLLSRVRGLATGRFAVGVTGLEGKVVEHTRGYRAQHATVLALAIADRGMLRVFDEPAGAAAIFDAPCTLEWAGSEVLSPRSSEEAMRSGITSFMHRQARRYETWTSGSSSE